MTKTGVLKINFKKLDPTAKAPVYKTSGAAGADVSVLKTQTIEPGEVAYLSTGIAIETPEGYMGLLAPRGSLCLKNNLHMPHSMGIFDSDYRGEVIVPLRNAGTTPITIEAGERIAQFIFVPIYLAEFLEVAELSESERGTGGFGSTGKH